MAGHLVCLDSVTDSIRLPHGYKLASLIHRSDLDLVGAI